MNTNLIGLSGKIQSGKDTVFDIINKRSGFIFENKKFADKIKDIVCILIGCTREQLEDHEFKDSHLGKEWSAYDDFNEHLCIMTPRFMLQIMGTECGRDIIHSDIWVNALFTDYNFEVGVSKDTIKDFLSNKKDIDNLDNYKIYPNWIITDVRFLNEVKAIREMGGIVIRIERPSKPSSAYPHLSEKALDSYKDFDYTIINNGSLRDLAKDVNKIIDHINK